MSGGRRLSTALAVLAGVAAVVCGFAVLARWAGEADPGQWRSLGTPLPETAAALATAGAALLLLVGRPALPRRVAGRLLGGVVAAAGALAVAESARLLTSPDGQLLADALDLTTPPPPSATTGLTLLLLGLALATVDVSTRRQLTWPQVFAPAAATIAGVTMLAYLFRETALPAVGALVAMTPLTALVALALTGGILAARPGQGLLRPLESGGPGGTLARRVGPTLLLLPFGIALVSGAVVQAGWGEPATTVALATAAFVLALLAVLAGTARVIDAADDRQSRLNDALAAERDFTRTLLNSLTEAVVVTDAELRVIDVNPGACELLGRERAQLLGQRPPYPWDEGVPARTRGADQRPVHRPDGGRVPVLALTAPVLDEQRRPRAFVHTFVDMTERQRAQDQLAAHAAELERANADLGQRAAALTDAAAFKNDLMSIVAHEVSQPLSSVASLSELLTAEWAELPDDMRQELASKIDRNTRRLTSMINDMLLLFRLDAGAVSARRAAVPLHEVLENVLGAVHADSVIQDVDPRLLALVDREHLWQILHHLVDNAVSYGDPPVEVTTRRAADGILVAVRDHGPGIPEEDRPTLFERVARRSGDKKRVKGTGLGLFIVRHLVEVNGGRIWYEPADPRGARLVVRLEPATPAAGEPAPAVAGTAPPVPA